ncbi:MviM Predicted dehydrogenases and related proteins [Candidatus Nanopelagicaceae bacterium]
MNDRIGVAVIGLGAMGRNHARVLTEIEDVDFLGALEIASSSLTEIYGRPIYRDINFLIAMRPDYCVIAVPTESHFEVAKTLMLSGINVLIEKPVTNNVIEANELIQIAEENKLICGVGHIERYNSALIEMKKLLDSNSLGKIFQISTFRQGPFPKRILDVGVVKDLATHDIDAVMWLTQAGYQRLETFGQKIGIGEHEDLIVSSAIVGNGIIINHQVNWINPVKTRQISILGEKGCYVADLLTSDLTYFEHGQSFSNWPEIQNLRGSTEGLVTRYSFEKSEPLKTEHMVFISAILSRNLQHVVTLESATETLKVAELMIEQLKN